MDLLYKQAQLEWENRPFVFRDTTKMGKINSKIFYEADNKNTCTHSHKMFIKGKGMWDLLEYWADYWLKLPIRILVEASFKWNLEGKNPWHLQDTLD